MVLESLLAVLALCVAGAAAAADGTPAAGTPFQVFSSGVAGFFEMFGIPVYIAQCFMTMCICTGTYQSGRRCTYRICQYLATVRICQPVTVRTGRKNHRTCQSLRSRICHIPGRRLTAYHCNSSDGTWPYYCHQFTESLL